MAVVTSTFSTAANDAWASTTWTSSDPSWKLNAQLAAWVSAIDDANKISIIHSPGNATERKSSDLVRWLLRAREADTGSDYGMIFCQRSAGNSSAGTNGTYFARTASTDNNGAGTYSTIIHSQAFSLTSAREHFTAYEAIGDRPWFAYSTKDSPTTGATYIIARLSTTSATAGSYYPSTGLGKWILLASSDAGGTAYSTPQARNTAPFIGINASGTTFNHPFPRTTYGDNYFFGLPALYGDTHYLGNTTTDIIVSNSATGVWGDTVTIVGITYMCLRAISSSSLSFWVRIS